MASTSWQTDTELLRATLRPKGRFAAIRAVAVEVSERSSVSRFSRLRWSTPMAHRGTNPRARAAFLSR